MHPKMYPVTCKVLLRLAISVASNLSTSRNDFHAFGGYSRNSTRLSGAARTESTSNLDKEMRMQIRDYNIER